MTTKEKLIDMLMQYGLFEEDCKTIVEIAMIKINKMVDNYSITWDRPWEEYPEVMYGLWFIDVKEAASLWIAINQPSAWYTAMFPPKV